MGLTALLARRAVRVVRVLIVAAPDAFTIRVAAERTIRARGWRLASTPADADVLLEAGRVGSELGDVAARLWDQLPGPRARVAAEVVTAVPAVLDEAAALLRDAPYQAEDAARRGLAEVGQDHEGADRGSEEMDNGDMDHGDMDHGDMTHGDMTHGDTDHGGMDHGGMDMSMSPDGIPLAAGSEDDRDGLEMDALPVRLGPVLPHWPAGLVLDATLHGDVTMSATARWVDWGGEVGTADEPDPGVLGPARACDDLAALLALAAWQDAATTAWAARDALMDSRSADALEMLGRVRRQVSASRVLRWSLRRTALIDADRARVIGLPVACAGDCYDRLLALIDHAHDLAAGAPGIAAPPLSLDVLEQAVLGLDLGSARLLIASLGTPTGEVVAVHA